METYRLTWNWSLLALLAAIVVLFAVDLWKLYRQSAEGASETLIRKLGIENRALMLLLALLLLASRFPLRPAFRGVRPRKWFGTATFSQRNMQTLISFDISARPARRTIYRLAILWLTLAAPLAADAQHVLPLENDRGQLFVNVMLHDSLPVRAMLESGIVYPLVDSALVWSLPELFRPQRLADTVHFRMANGARYDAAYKLPPGLPVGGSRSLCDTYVVDMHGYDCDLLYPLHTFSTDSTDRPGIFSLSIRDGEVRMLAPDELPATQEGWTVFPMLRDETYAMYCVEVPFSMRNRRGKRTARPMGFVVDLGNANLLALFTFKPEVASFVARTNIPVQQVETVSGHPMRIVLPAETCFMDSYAFIGLPVLVLHRKMRLPGDGFLGTRFFERFRVIFDFRNERLWLAAQPERKECR